MRATKNLIERLPKGLLERLPEIFTYDAKTGELRWKVDKGQRGRAGRPVGGAVHSSGYLVTHVEGTFLLQHRAIWALVHGYWPENQIDHINRNKLDNRLDNLREVSPSCNVRNSRVRSDSRSGIKGVLFHSGIKRWCAAIRCEGRRQHIIATEDKVEAVAHRLAAEQHLSWMSCEAESPAKLFMQNYLRGEG